MSKDRRSGRWALLAAALCSTFAWFVLGFLHPWLTATSVESSFTECSEGFFESQSVTGEAFDVFWFQRFTAGIPFAVAFCSLLFTFLTTRLFERVGAKLYHLSASLAWALNLIVNTLQFCRDPGPVFGVETKFQFSVSYSTNAGYQVLTSFFILGMVCAKVMEVTRGGFRARVLSHTLVVIVVIECLMLVVFEYAWTFYCNSQFTAFPNQFLADYFASFPIYMGLLDLVFTVLANSILWSEYLEAKHAVTEAPDREDIKAHLEDLWRHFLSAFSSTSTTTLFYLSWFFLNDGLVEPRPRNYAAGWECQIFVFCGLLDSVTNDLAVQFMLRPGALTTMEKAIRAAIKKVREERDLSSWMDGHTFNFIDADKLRESAGPLPRFQDLLKSGGWLIPQVLSLKGILLGRIHDTVVVSYTWLKKDHPDPNGELMDCLREFLCRNRHIKKVWLDWTCLPQPEHTPEEDVVMKASLKCANLVYLGVPVVVLFTPGYKARFWPLLELFLSFQCIGPQGLILSKKILTSCIPAQSFKDKPEECAAEWEKLKAEISSLSVEQLGDYLADPSINVTSGKDRTIQLGKILQLKDNIAWLWSQLSVELTAERVEQSFQEPTATQATQEIKSSDVKEKVIVWF